MDTVKKRPFMMRIADNLIIPDADNPIDDETKRRLMKRGLLQAGLEMLASPTGQGGVFQGIGKGLLAGANGVAGYPDELRKRQLDMNRGNVSPARIRELDQASQRLGLTKGTPEYNDFMQRQYGGLPKASNMSEWTTKVTDTGEIYRTNELGGLQYFDKASRSFVDMAQPQTPRQPTHQSPTQSVSQNDGVNMPAPKVGSGIVFPEDLASASNVVAGKMQGVREEIARRVRSGVPVQVATQQVVSETMPNNQQRAIPPSRQSNQGLPNLGKPTEAKSVTWSDPKPYIKNGQTVMMEKGSDGTERIRNDLLPPISPAQEASNLAKQARLDNVVATTDNLVSAIQGLRSHKAYKDLGSVSGELSDQFTPERMPTDYRGAKGMLDSIKAGIVLQAMAALKQYSAAGATGFGALNKAELETLQNSIAYIQTNQKHEDLDKSLNTIIRLVTKAKSTTPNNPATNTPNNSNSGAVWVRDANGKLVKKAQ